MPHSPPATERNTHLFAPGPKRILSLDGGGTRGIVSLAFLERLETVLRARHPDRPDLRLSDYFDLIGGTSTGAIIAAGLALGMEVADVRDLYLELAPRVFRRRFWRIWALQALFSHAPLMRLLRQHLGDRTLDDPAFRTGLAIVTKRLDTGSPWILSNNPRAPYWDDPADKSFVGNRHYELATIVRASTAAPFFFRPERIAILLGEPHGLFVDGGVSPYNNPSLALLLLARLKIFGLDWSMAPDRLLLISVGTGRFRLRLQPNALMNRTALGLALHSLAGLITDVELSTLTLLQTLSEPAAPHVINSEIGDLRGESLAGAPLLSFQRYDLDLEQVALSTAGLPVSARDLLAMRDIASVIGMPLNAAHAVRAAKIQVDPAHLPAAFDLPPVDQPGRVSARPSAR